MIVSRELGGGFDLIDYKTKDIKLDYDFLSLVGIQHEDSLWLYGAIPRFWHGTFSDAVQPWTIIKESVLES
jgi:hypothetical protein